VDGGVQAKALLVRRTALLLALLLLGALSAACGGSAVAPVVARAANRAVAGAPLSTGTPGGAGSSLPSSAPPTGSALSSAEDVPATAPDPGSLTGGGVPSAAEGLPGAGGGVHEPGTSAGGVPAVAAPKHERCAGFRNQTGVTDSTITLANVADISGPVPGIFTSAQEAVKAYVAYFNATSRLCGRKLALLALDSRTDAGADQTAYVRACHETFAAVGSMSAFDSGGAATAQDCGLPDLRSASVSDARNSCSTCFGAQATDLHAFQNAVPDFFLAHHHAATQHAAMIYVNAAASVQNAKTQQQVEEQRGMRFVYSAAFDVAEFNYTPYVQRMQEKGVRWVQFVGSTDEAVRLAQAMQNAKFHPEVYLLDPTAYNPTFVKSGGSAVDGSYVFMDFTPFEEAASSKELQLYEAWLQQVAPGSRPSYFGLFAWSAARLFGQEAAALGGQLDRARLVARIRGVSGWTDRGLHAPQAVGPKVNSSCWRFLQLHGTTWQPAGSRQYLCHGSTTLH